MQCILESLLMIGFMWDVLWQIVSRCFRFGWRIMNWVGLIHQYIVAKAIICITDDTDAAIEIPQLPYDLGLGVPTLCSNCIIAGVMKVWWLVLCVPAEVCVVCIITPIAYVWNAAIYTLDGVDGESYSSRFRLGITKGVMKAPIVLCVRVGVCVVRLVDGLCFPSF